MIQVGGQASSRKRRVSELTRQCWRLWGVLSALGVVAIGGGAWLLISSNAKATASDHLPEIAIQENSDLNYDLSQLRPSQSRLFSYPVSSSERERLLVSRDSKGTIRVAFASCTVCYRLRAQHYLKEGKLICAQCEHTMRIGEPGERLTSGKGCIAVPVSFSIENGRVIVRTQAILEAAKAFTRG